MKNRRSLPIFGRRVYHYQYSSEPCVGASDTVESIPTVEGAGVVVKVVEVVVVADWAAKRLKWSL
jgi:hypothetical protein